MTTPKSAGGLGFRDIELFNLALLARQAWRILQNQETLSARIRKAVYYPEGEFLEAQLGSHPSKIWRAMIDARDTLKQGLIRKIGTGQNTHPWNDNWLPRDAMMRPVACVDTDDNDASPGTVAEFIDETSASWKVQRLEKIFLPMDVEVIRNIPLVTRVQSDFWAWHF